MREIALGLGDTPNRRFLFVSQDEAGSGSCWYELNFDTKAKTSVPQRALTGYITGLRLKETTFRGEHKWKLDILMDAGHPFAIRSGVDTVFTRGLILALIAIEDPEKLKDVLTIAVSPSKDNQKIVFGKVYDGRTGARVKFEWDKDAMLVPLIQHLQTILGDGGQTDDPEHDEEPGESQSDAEGSPQVGYSKVSPAQPNGASEAQTRELLRCAKLAGLAFEPGTPQESLVELHQHTGNLYKFPDGKPKTIFDLTRDEAIAYRKTLLAL